MTRAELTGCPPEPIRVGAGCAFYLEGTLESARSIESVELAVGGTSFPVADHSMPEAGRYEGGTNWWAPVTLRPPLSGPTLPLRLKVRARGGRLDILPLGQLAVAAGFGELPDPYPVPVGLIAAGEDRGSGDAAGQPPLVAICMATYEPRADWLARQLDSIREQTHERWVCVISDDGSSPQAYAEIERQVAGDERFLLSRAEQRGGFLRNFERALALAPAEAELLAFSDQDDRWDADKLEVMVVHLAAHPDAELAYSDIRIADEQGRILSDTHWYDRRNCFDDMASILIANTVTGAASVFRRSLLDAALPFPPSTPGRDVYHDHWLALCALAQGRLTYLDRPTHDYTRHDESVTVKAERTWVRPPQGRLGRLKMRAARLTRRFRLSSRGPWWRWTYVNRYLLMRQLATMLELRLGGRILPRHRRDLNRILAADRSWRAAAWLIARSFRGWIGRNETLAGERVIVGGILWRKYAERRARS